jgi:hypothetical protein
MSLTHSYGIELLAVQDTVWTALDLLHRSILGEKSYFHTRYRSTSDAKWLQSRNVASAHIPQRWVTTLSHFW